MQVENPIKSKVVYPRDRCAGAALCNFNLDLKNPSRKVGLEHLPSYGLAEGLLVKEKQITAMLEEIKGLFQRHICYNHDMSKVKFSVPEKKLAEFCRRWNISELALFGSALREDFRPDSDVDILVSFSPQAQVTLFDMAQMQEELKDIFKRDVDLVSKRGLENSRNYLRRKQILGSAQVIHVAR